MSLVAELVSAQDYYVGCLRRQYGSMPTSGEADLGGGWLAANGALVSQAKYPKLFAEIGHAYNPAGPGIDPGGGNFYLPDHTDGRNPIPKGATNFPTRGARGGAKTVALAGNGSDEPNHSHPYNDQLAARSGSGQFSTQTGHGADSGADQGFTSGGVSGHPGGSPQAHQNMPPVLVVGGWKIRYV